MVLVHIHQQDPSLQQGHRLRDINVCRVTAIFVPRLSVDSVSAQFCHACLRMRAVFIACCYQHLTAQLPYAALW
jgi:hypothetical protein